MTIEAFEPGGLLTHEDLAFRLLNCRLRTIVRDVEQLRGTGLAVPTRGQQQDIGPGQTHRVQAVRLFLKGLEPREIAKRLYHSLSAIENYVTTFARFPASLTHGMYQLIAAALRWQTVIVACPLVLVTLVSVDRRRVPAADLSGRAWGSDPHHSRTGGPDRSRGRAGGSSHRDTPQWAARLVGLDESTHLTLERN
jgi:hypothetical protein